jgi:formylglycine-generating enzyme required for sulfatase activity
MRPIPAGKFEMGSNDAKNPKYWIDPDDEATFPGLEEAPIHPVTVKAFCMDVTEVTVSAYRACVASSQCTEPSLRDATCGWRRKDHDDHPVDCVTFSQASQYCAAVGKRLPTEEEWEYAARGTDGRRFPWGNTEPEFTFVSAKPGFCWHIDQPTCSVSQFPNTRSPFGVLNLVDNVSEWTSSYECSYATGVCTKNRILRGGSVSSHAAGVRAAYREAAAESGLGAPRIGFRCARSN